MSLDQQTSTAVTEKPAEYHKVMEQAEAGQHEEAMAYLESYLTENNRDAEAHNDAGAILMIQGHTDRAIEHLSKAHDLYSDSAEINWNLSEALLVGDQAEKAAALFGGMEQMGILSTDMLNRTAVAFIDDQKPAEALPLLQKSLELEPDQEVLESIITVVRSKIDDNNGQTE
ncbi:MAG: tetratricopeptide repeat protein [Planctomycetota bacterium]|jgi:tetratricopeptide (TPR) repeat protein